MKNEKLAISEEIGRHEFENRTLSPLPSRNPGKLIRFDTALYCYTFDERCSFVTPCNIILNITTIVDVTVSVLVDVVVVVVCVFKLLCCGAQQVMWLRIPVQ